MSIALPLKEMSFAEKIQTMELLWDDLCKNPKRFESPKWHLDELNYREQLVKDGKAEYLDWETVKKIFEKKLNE